MIIFAFDIERSGQTTKHDTIAVGVSVLNSKTYKEVDYKFWPMYFKKDCIFSPRCWSEFWIKFPNVLKQLEYNGSLTKKQRLVQVAREFQELRIKWSNFSKQNNLSYMEVSDNPKFDARFMNEMIETSLPGVLGFPYSPSIDSKKQPQCYGHIRNVSDLIRGFLMCCDPTYKKLSCGWTQLKKLYLIPDQQYNHTHLPHEDAYCIAFKYAVLENIRDGHLQKIKEQKTY